MLTISDSLNSLASRRDVLRIGALGLGGLSLPAWLAAQANAAPSAKDYVYDRSIVLLFLCGGPSHIETFDPHMERPSPQRSVTGEVQTALPGVTFGGTFSKLAARADRLAVVRSYSPHEISDHAKAIYHTLTAGAPLGRKASLGSMITRLRGNTFTPKGVPTFAELIEDEVESQYQEDMERMRTGNASGSLGPAHAPFAALGGDGLQNNMELSLPLERLQQRRALLHSFDQLRRAHTPEAMKAVDQYESQAIELLLGGRTREALDLSREDPRVVARYETSAWRSGWSQRRPSTLGRRLLMARRLCEAGCRFVTVGMAGWDNHGNGNHPGVFEGMHLLGEPVDHAVAAFLDDLRDRGLSDKILLVITGEFGRGPKFENQGGRPHWPGLCPLVFAGGGLPMGQVIGRSLPTADYPATEPYRLEHLVSTLMHASFDLGKLRLDSTLPRDLAQIAQQGDPIRELIGR